MYMYFYFLIELNDFFLHADIELSVSVFDD